MPEIDSDRCFVLQTQRRIWMKFLPYVYDGLDRIAVLRDLREEGIVYVAGIYAGKAHGANLYRRLDTRQMSLVEKEISSREKGVKEIRFLQLEPQASERA